MTDIVNYKEQDGTFVVAQTGNTSSTEMTAVTVAWEDLTGAGFAAGDDALVIWSWSQACNDTGEESIVEIREGSTFAGASTLETYIARPAATLWLEGANQFTHIERITLTSGNDFYIGLSTSNAAADAKIGNWSFLAIKLDDLAADDFRFNENTTAEKPGTTYASYASVTLPSGGGDDWLVLGTVRIDVTTTVSTQFRSRLSLGGTGRMEQSHECEASDEFYGLGKIGYLAAASGSAVCAVQCENATSNDHEHTRSAIVALRMEAFTDHAGNMDQDSIAAPTSGDTFKEMNTVTHTATATGDVFYFAQSIADVEGEGIQPYLRVQDDGADMMGSGVFVNSTSSRDSADQLGPLAFGVASVASGANTIDCDAAIRFTGTAFNFDEHALVTFSADLAPQGGGGPTIAPIATHHLKQMAGN